MVAIYDLTARQLTNAQAIYRAALPYGRDAVMAALMTAGAESSWLRYANNGKSTRTDVSEAAKRVAAVSMTFDHDAVAGEAWTTADSVGLFQQRPMYGYGTVADLMDPTRSTIIFLTGNAAHTTRAFMNAPDGLTLAQRCQWTQGSEFPTGDNYAPFENVAAQLIERFGAVDIPTSPTPATPATGAGATVTDWITSMVSADQQKQLDDYARTVDNQDNSRNTAANVEFLAENERIEGQPFSKSAHVFNVVQAIEKKVDALAAALDLQRSDVDGQEYSVPAFAVSADRKATENANAIAELSAKIDALGAAMDSKK